MTFFWLYKQLGLIGCILLITVILLVCVAGYLYVSRNNLKNLYVDTTNELIKSDSLKVVLKYDNKTLSERYANQSRDLNEQVVSNKILQKYIKDRDIKILSLVDKVETVTIENQKLKGKISKDSLGNEIATFDTTNEYYSLEAVTQIRPLTYLQIANLTIMDSSSIGIGRINENGLLEGFITHSNPYVQDKNAMFNFQLTDKEGFEIPSFKVNWKWIPVSIAVGGIGVYLLIK
jgi:hypothetical protein